MYPDKYNYQESIDILNKPDNKNSHWTACSSLSDIKNKDCIPLLLGLLQAPKIDVDNFRRSAYIMAIGKIEPLKYKKMIVEYLLRPEDSYHSFLISSFEKVAQEDDVYVLEELVRNIINTSLFFVVMNVYKCLPPSVMIKSLEKLFLETESGNRRHKYIRQYCMWTLRDYNDEAVDTLIGIANITSDKEIHLEITNQMKNMKSEKIAAYLTNIAYSESTYSLEQSTMF